MRRRGDGAGYGKGVVLELAEEPLGLIEIEPTPTDFSVEEWEEIINEPYDWVEELVEMGWADPPRPEAERFLYRRPSQSGPCSSDMAEGVMSIRIMPTRIMRGPAAQADAGGLTRPTEGKAGGRCPPTNVVSSSRAMGLVAYSGSRRLVAPLLSEEEWRSIADARLPCGCAAQKVEADSRRPRHFKHAHGAACGRGASESPQHLLAKEVIAEALAEAGLEVRVEHDLGSCRLDVFAETAEGPLAFEVQLSPQRPSDLYRRTDKIALSGVDRVIWLQRPGTAHLLDPSFPQLELHRLDSRPFFEVSLASGRVGLDELARGAAAGRLEFAAPVRLARRQRLETWFVEARCWRCEKPAQFLVACGWLRDEAGRELEEAFYNLTWDAVGRRFALAAARGELPVRALLEYRMIKQVGEPMWTNVCPSCKATIGSTFLVAEHIAPKLEAGTLRAPDLVLEIELNRWEQGALGRTFQGGAGEWRLAP